MAPVRGAGARGEKREPVVQPGHEVGDRKHPHGAGGELDGQRQAVQPGAYGADVCLVRVGQRERGIDVPRPVQEQLDRLAVQQVGRGSGGRVGCREPGDLVHHLARQV